MLCLRPGLAMPSGACARSSRGRWSWSASARAAGPSAAARGQLAPDHFMRGRGRVPWASCARRCQLPPRLTWAVDHAARPAWAAAPGADQPTGPRDFPPRIGPGFPPVTRAWRISPAHNARPRRFPRNALSINHSDMKSTIFVSVRLHENRGF